MKKVFIIFFILTLIFFTTFIKNSTKKIEDEILIVDENLRDLKKELGDSKLEFDYLSSAEKLLKFQSMYFEQELIQQDINLIKKLQITLNGIEVKDFTISSSNE
tara:strand:+ start:187 stop:498 length:312 start_codon:yes stop_codon:yes gene_type:complete